MVSTLLRSPNEKENKLLIRSFLTSAIRFVLSEESPTASFHPDQSSPKEDIVDPLTAAQVMAGIIIETDNILQHPTIDRRANDLALIVDNIAAHPDSADDVETLLEQAQITDEDPVITFNRQRLQRIFTNADKIDNPHRR